MAVDDNTITLYLKGDKFESAKEKEFNCLDPALGNSTTRSLHSDLTSILYVT